MTAGTSALLIAIGGGVAGVAALTKDKDSPDVVTAVGRAAQAVPPAAVAGDRPPAPPGPAAAPALDQAVTVPRTSDEADRTATRSPRRAGGEAPAADLPAPARTTGPAAAQRPAGVPAPPVRAVRIEVETREIPFPTRVVRDPALPRGAQRVQAPGVPGEETLRFQVTLVDGRITDRRLVDTAVTREPQPRVVAFGVRRGQGQGQWHGHGHGHRLHRHPHQRPDRDCRRALEVCVPLGRSAMCPDNGGRTESAVQPAGKITLSAQDLALLDADALEAVEGLAC